MPSTATLERFILRVEQNDHAGAVEEFYMPNASLQENQSAPRIGRDTQIKRERDLLTKVRTITSHCVRPQRNACRFLTLFGPKHDEQIPGLRLDHSKYRQYRVSLAPMMRLVIEQVRASISASG
jgi:hypothetical protein